MDSKFRKVAFVMALASFAIAPCFSPVEALGANPGSEMADACRGTVRKLTKVIMDYKASGGDPMDLYQSAGPTEKAKMVGNYMNYLAGGGKSISSSDLESLGYSRCMSLHSDLL